MSHHFNVLKATGLLPSEPRGQSIVYSLNASVFQDVASILLDLFQARLPKAPGANKKLDPARR